MAELGCSAAAPPARSLIPRHSSGTVGRKSEATAAEYSGATHARCRRPSRRPLRRPPSESLPNRRTCGQPRANETHIPRRRGLRFENLSANGHESSRCGPSPTAPSGFAATQPARRDNPALDLVRAAVHRLRGGPHHRFAIRPSIACRGLSSRCNPERSCRGRPRTGRSSCASSEVIIFVAEDSLLNSSSWSTSFHAARYRASARLEGNGEVGEALSQGVDRTPRILAGHVCADDIQLPPQGPCCRRSSPARGQKQRRPHIPAAVLLTDRVPSPGRARCRRTPG